MRQYGGTWRAGCTWSRAELAELDRLRAIWQAARQGHGRGRTQGRKGEE